MRLSFYSTITFLFLARLLNAQNELALFGIWQNSEFGYQMTLILNPDGTGEFDGEPILFSATPNTLKLDATGIQTVYNYTINKNTMNLSGGDLDGAIAFTRSGAETKVDGLPTTSISSTNTTKSNALNNELVGIWSGSGETIEFKKNGECAYLGNIYKFHFTANRITLVTNQGDITFGYLISNNQLTLTGNAGRVVYTKGNTDATIPSTNTKGIAMELVGKWCWIDVTNTNSGGSQSSRCIILNADGTYLFQSERSASVNTNSFYGGTNSQSSDQGTWYVQGERIFYNSQTTGQGSYRLEKRNHPKNINDPMIVLDGEAYVTVTLRQPWR